MNFTLSTFSLNTLFHQNYRLNIMFWVFERRVSQARRTNMYRRCAMLVRRCAKWQPFYWNAKNGYYKAVLTEPYIEVR